MRTVALATSFFLFLFQVSVNVVLSLVNYNNPAVQYIHSGSMMWHSYIQKYIEMYIKWLEYASSIISKFCFPP